MNSKRWFYNLQSDHPIIIGLDLCTDHAHYVKNKDQRYWEGINKNMAVQGGIVSHYFILVIRKFIDFMSLSDIVRGFLFFYTWQVFSAEFGICNL